MDDYQPTDDQIEMLLTGRSTGTEPSELLELIEALSVQHLSAPAVMPNTALREFLRDPAADDLTQSSDETKERSPMKKLATGVGAVAATAAGKLVLATAVAATTIGGAGAAGVIDLPGNGPDNRPVLVPEVSERPALAVEVESGPENAPDRGDKQRPETHGSEISTLATESEDRGCEFGQSIAAAASANADDHRRDDEREEPVCEQADAPGLDGDGTNDEQPGMPDDPGKPADVGPPDTTPEAPGRPEDPGKPEDLGKPEDPGKPIPTPEAPRLP